MSAFNARRPVVARRIQARRREAALFESIETRYHCDADNSIATPTNLGTVATYVSKTGSINKSSDATDFYKLTVPSGTKTVKIGLSGLTANNADLYLYDSSKKQISSSKLTGTTDTITKTGLAAGTYYAEVRAVTGSSNYTLKAESDLTGDSRDAARDLGTLTVNTTKTVGEYVGSLDSGDYYKFKISAARDMLIQLDGLSGDANIELLNASGTSLATSKNTGNTAEEINRPNLAAGTYYAKVTPASSSKDAKYTLELGNFTVNTDPGGTLDSAKDIGTFSNDTKTYTEKVGGYDADLYKFKFNKTGLLTLNLSGLSQDADLALLDSNGNTLATSTRGGTAAEDLIRGINAGTYYIQVTPLAPDTPNTNYTLKVSTSDGAYDSYGDGIDDATDTYVGPSGNGTGYGYIVNGQNQEDFLKVHVTQPGNLTAFIYGLSDDLDLRIVNSSGVVVKSATSASTSSESISYTVPSAGTYYLQISQGIFGPSGSASSYSLQYHVPTDEAGNTRALAQAVNTPYTGTGVVGQFDTTDFYRVDVDTNHYLQMTLSTSDNPVTLAFYNADGSLIDFASATTAKSATLSYYLHDGGVRYVGVLNSANNLANYGLSIKTVAVAI